MALQRRPLFLLLIVSQAIPAVWLCRDFVFQGKLLLSPEILDMSLPWARSLDAVGWRLDQALWDRHSFCGIPFLANPSLRAFYPPDLILRLLTPVSPEVSFSWLILSHLVLLGLGSALWISRSSRSAWVMNLGGWLFLLSGYISSRTGLADPAFLFAATWMPWILYTLPVLASRWGKVCLTLLLVLEILAGRPDLAFFFFWCLAACIFVVWGKRFFHPQRLRYGRRYFLALISAFTAALLICSVQLIPTFELQQHTVNRSGNENFDFAATDSLVPGLLLASFFPGIFGDPTVAIPDRVVGSPGSFWGQGTGFHEFFCYMGQGTVLLLLAAIMGRRTRLASFWVLIVLLGLLFAFGRYTPFFRWIIDYLPGWDRFRVPPRILILYVLGIVWLACQGFGHILREKIPPRFFLLAFAWVLLVFAFALSCSLGLSDNLIALFGPDNISQAREGSPMVYHQMAGDITDALWLAGFICLAQLICLWVPSPGGRKIFCCILLLDLLWHNGNFITGKTQDEIAREFLQDPLIQKYRESGEQGRLLTLATVMAHQRRPAHPWFFPGRLFDYSIENVGGYGPFLLEEYVHAFQQLDPGQITYNNGLLLFLFHMDSLNQPLFNLFQVSHVISPDRPIRGFQVVASQDYTALNGSSSRLFLSRNPVLYPRAFLFRDSSDGAIPKPDPSSGHCQIESVSSTSMVLSTSAAMDCRMAILETWFPGWQAQVNGKDQPIEKLAATFRWISIPKGISTINLAYRPLSWRIGLWLSVCGLILLAAGIVQSVRKKHPI